jgi:hypothetical protein
MLKKLAGATAIAGALGWSAVGLGAGVVNAAPVPQVAPGTVHSAPLPADHDGGDWWGGHGHGHGHWGHGGDWDGGGWGGGWGGPGWGWGGPVACGSVGWVSGCIG